MAVLEADGGCSCSHVRFAIDGTPLFRAYCHCLTCQAYNQADRADIIVMRSEDVALTGGERIAFRFHQNPPILRRGRCKDCDGVAIETISLPLSPNVTIIPAQTLDAPTAVPEPAFHMFYHRRVADADDALPKHSGYLGSQLAFSSALMGAVLRGSNAR